MKIGPCDAPFSSMGTLHFMGDWGEPRWVQCGAGSKMVQERRCGRCKLVEVREVMVG